MFKYLKASQAKKPHGVFGYLMGKIYKRDNEHHNDWVIGQLNIKFDEKILEIGFGTGESIFKIAQQFQAQVFGVDISPIMFKKANKLNKENIKNGKVELKLGSVPPLPYEDEFFDKVFAVFVIYFWDDPMEALKEIYRVLKVGGLVGLYLTTKEVLEQVPYYENKIFNSYTPEELIDFYGKAGFRDVKIDYSDGGKRMLVTGRR